MGRRIATRWLVVCTGSAAMMVIQAAQAGALGNTKS